MHTSDITRALYGRIRALYGKFDVIKMGVVGVLAVIIIIMNYQREWKTVVFVKSFSGEKLRGIEGYVQPSLKEVSVMLHSMSVQMPSPQHKILIKLLKGYY